MDGKILNIPVILIFLVTAIVLPVCVLIVVLHSVSVTELNTVKGGMRTLYLQGEKTNKTLGEMIEATKSATIIPEPTKAPVRIQISTPKPSPTQ